MKKFLSVVMIALMVGAFVSCNSKTGKAGNDKATTHDDSVASMIATFMGGQVALEANDTINGGDIEIDEFLRGFNEAYKENTSYSRGKQTGAQLAQNLSQFEQQFKIKIDRDKFLATYIKAVKDKTIDENKMQSLGSQLQQIMMQAMMGSSQMQPAPEDEAEAAQDDAQAQQAQAQAKQQ